MNYGVKATKKRIRAANSRKKKYANRLFLTFFRTAFVLVLFLCVTGVSTFIGMFKGILDSSPDFNPDSFTPSGYFSTIYNSAGEVTDTLVGSNSNRIDEWLGKYGHSQCCESLTVKPKLHLLVEQVSHPATEVRFQYGKEPFR